jgi:hypothetical protein
VREARGETLAKAADADLLAASRIDTLRAGVDDDDDDDDDGEEDDDEEESLLNDAPNAARAAWATRSEALILAAW